MELMKWVPAYAGTTSSAAGTTSARVEVARSPAELERIVPAWEALARAAIEPNPFYEPWMLLPALRAFAGGQELRIVQVWVGDELAGLFPLERAATYKGLPAATLRSWRHPHCLLCTPLVRRELAEAALAGLFAEADASLLELHYIPAAEPFARALAAYSPAVTRSYTRPLLRKHRATVSANLRRRLGRQERALAKLGALSHVTLGPNGDAARWIEDFLRIEAGGWKGRKGGAMACKETNRGYAAEIFAEAFRRGRLMGCGLDLDGEPIARRLSFAAGEGSYAFKTAYDERYAEFSPGVLMEADNVRQLDADPALEWMDSFTEDGNLGVERLWPDRREMHSLLAATGPWGRAILTALPALRWLRGKVQGKYSRA